MSRLEGVGKTFFSRVFKRKPPKGLFMHIQKTAGSSLVDIAKYYYRNKNMISHGDHLGHDAREFMNVVFISGHFGYEFAKPLMPGRYSFTFLRDPVERILSLYFFCRGQNPDDNTMYKCAHELSLEGFLHAGFEDPVIKTHIWNNQVWQLACGYSNPEEKYYDSFEASEMLNMAKAHLNDFSYVGFTETFEEDRNIILSALEIPVPKEKVESNVNPDRKSAADISAEAARLLQDLTILDRNLYEFSWKKYKGNKIR